MKKEIDHDSITDYPSLVKERSFKPALWSNPLTKPQFKRWWPVTALLVSLLFIIVTTLSVTLSVPRSFQKWIDQTHLSSREWKAFLRKPQSIHGIVNDGFEYSGPSLLHRAPWPVEVTAFNVTVSDRRGDEFMMIEYPAHSNVAQNVTSTVRFIDYDVLKRIVKHATLKHNVEVTIDALVPYTMHGKSSFAELHRNETFSPEQLSYLGLHSDATPLGSTLNELKEQMREKHRSMLKIENVTPTDVGFDATVGLTLASYKVHAELGNLKVGMWLGRHKVLDVNTHTSMRPGHSTFESKVALMPGWNDTMGDTTVSEVLRKAAEEKHGRVAVTFIGEHASKAKWLSVITRAVRTTQLVPASFVEKVLLAAGMPAQSVSTNRSTTVLRPSYDQLELFD